MRAFTIGRRYAGLAPVHGVHKTGIYTYEKLRASCECDECRKRVPKR